MIPAHDSRMPNKGNMDKSNKIGQLLNVRHFLESEKTTKRHSRETKAGLWMTKVTVNKDGIPVEGMGTTFFMRLVDMEDKLHNKVFLDQMGTFP